MPLHHNDGFMDLEIESRLLADQIRAGRVDYDFVNFINAEKKKYKKTNEIEDLINNYKLKP